MEKGLQLEDSNLNIHYNLACVNALLTQKEEMLHHLTQAITLDPKYLKMVRHDPDFLTLFRPDP